MNDPRTLWDLDKLSQPPRVYAARGFKAEGIKAVFFEGPPYKGRPTRVFAWYGVPKVRRGERVPGIIILHGGGQSAQADQVQLWNLRGYAAIAPDNCGNTPDPQEKHQRHKYSGPPGWCGFDQIDEPIRDHHMYHAIANVILANSFLRSRPCVDPERIGLIGGSMGAYLACCVAGVDQRLAMSVNVYGCGFLGDNSFWLDTFRQMGPDKARRWLSLWDPSVYLPHAKIPMLWMTGTNDRFFPLDSFQKSYRAAAGPRALAVRARMFHGHWRIVPYETVAFANHVLKGDRDLIRIEAQRLDGRVASVSYVSPGPIDAAEFNYTTDRGPWVTRRWTSTAADIDHTQSRVTARVPEGTSVFFFNLTDKDGYLVSTEHVELPEE